jgi:hypothetical protein
MLSLLVQLDYDRLTKIREMLHAFHVHTPSRDGENYQ